MARVGIEDFVDLFRRDFAAANDVELSPDTKLFDELEFDSFEYFRLMVLIEELAGLAVPEDDPPLCETLGSAYRYYLSCADHASTGV